MLSSSRSLVTVTKYKGEAVADPPPKYLLSFGSILLCKVTKRGLVNNRKKGKKVTRYGLFLVGNMGYMSTIKIATIQSMQWMLNIQGQNKNYE